MSEGLSQRPEQELSPEQYEEVRGILRGLTDAMSQRVPAESNGIMRQSSWTGQRGAKLVYLGMGATVALKVHGLGATSKSSEYTFGTMTTADGAAEELTVQHPRNHHHPVTELNGTDLKFLRYVESEFYDPASEMPEGDE